MRRKLRTQLAGHAALAAAVAVAGGVRAQQANPYTTQIFVACYIYQVPGSSSTYLPVVGATKYEVFDNLATKVYRSVLPNPQPGQNVSCKTGDTPEAAEEARQKTGYVKAAERPWPDDVPVSSRTTKPPTKALDPKPTPAVTPPKAPTQPAPVPSLTVKADTSAMDAAKAWDEQVKKTVAVEAQRRVEAAAKQAQADAKRQAEYEAFFAERRKQGRGQ